MKRIFIGSSFEALKQAEQIAQALSPYATPLLWTEIFSPGVVTLEGIEQTARTVSGAVFLASPDDESVIRDKHVVIPRSNVMFEYGYLCAALGRRSVALCKYDGVALPTDFDGLTYVPMGAFPTDPSSPMPPRVLGRLIEWTRRDVHDLASGTSRGLTLHGYSSGWRYTATCSRWRGIDLKSSEYVDLRGTVEMRVPLSGEGGHGFLYGTLSVQLEECYAEFSIGETISRVEVRCDGTVTFDSNTHTRQRVRLDGTPRQQDGFGAELRGGRTCRHQAVPSPAQASTLHGGYVAMAGEQILTQATTAMVRLL